MQKISAFFMAFVAIFLSFFYGYNATTAKYLQNGVDSSTISSDKISIEIENEIGASTDKIDVKFTNYTNEAYKFNNFFDVEVLVNGKWYALPQTVINHLDGSSFTIGGNEEIFHTFKGVNTYHIKSGGTYRIIVGLTSQDGDVTVSSEFNT